MGQITFCRGPGSLAPPPPSHLVTPMLVTLKLLLLKCHFCRPRTLYLLFFYDIKHWGPFTEKLSNIAPPPHWTAVTRGLWKDLRASDRLKFEFRPLLISCVVGHPDYSSEKNRTRSSCDWFISLSGSALGLSVVKGSFLTMVDGFFSGGEWNLKWAFGQMGCRRGPMWCLGWSAKFPATLSLSLLLSNLTGLVIYDFRMFSHELAHAP